MGQCFDDAHQTSDLDSVVHFKCMNSLPLVLLFYFLFTHKLFAIPLCLKLIVSLVLRVMKKNTAYKLNARDANHQRRTRLRKVAFTSVENEIPVGPPESQVTDGLDNLGFRK